MMKRFAAVFTALILALAALSVTVSAVGTCNLKQTSVAKAGEKFTVDVEITPDDELASLSVSIRYDAAKLKVESVKDNGILEGFYDVKLSNSVQLTWTGNGKALKTAGTYATVTFSVIEEDPAGTMLQSTVTANTSGHIRVPVDGSTAIILFDTAVDSTEPVTPNPNEPVPDDGTPESTEDVENIEDEEDVVDVSEATTEVTTEATTTKATTTRRPKKTKATITTAATTPATTTATTPVTTPATTPATTPEPVTTPESVTTPEPEVTGIAPDDDAVTMPDDDSEPISENYDPEQSESNFAEAYTDTPSNKGADRGTILIALMALALTVVVVVAIEMTKRGK